MSKLKSLMFILLSIIFSSCYDINDTCNDTCNGFLERVNAPPGNIGIVTIAVASSGDIWVCTADEVHEDYNIIEKVYLSTNNGDTWDLKASFLYPSSLISSMAISPINGYIFISFRQGLFRSTDRGITWVSVKDNVNVYDILIKPSGGIYFAAGNTIYYSSDNGDTWIEKNNGFPESPGYISALALGKDDMLYAGTWFSGVYRSTDDGATWLPSSNYNDAPSYELTISNDGSILSATNSKGILKSSDKGVTWTQLSDLSAYKIVYNSITEDIFVKVADNVYRSTDKGVTWTKILTYNTAKVFAFNPNTGQMYLGGYEFYRFTK